MCLNHVALHWKTRVPQCSITLQPDESGDQRSNPAMLRCGADRSRDGPSQRSQETNDTLVTTLVLEVSLVHANPASRLSKKTATTR